MPEKQRCIYFRIVIINEVIKNFIYCCEYCSFAQLRIKFDKLIFSLYDCDYFPKLGYTPVVFEHYQVSRFSCRYCYTLSELKIAVLIENSAYIGIKFRN